MFLAEVESTLPSELTGKSPIDSTDNIELVLVDLLEPTFKNIVIGIGVVTPNGVIYAYSKLIERWLCVSLKFHCNDLRAEIFESSKYELVGRLLVSRSKQKSSFGRFKDDQIFFLY